jgi:ATP-dependent RNA helicase DeaD
MTQVQRDRVMKQTRGGALDLLVATDVAARGLDIDHLSHVVNVNVPESPAAYVHRIGRTGRAGRAGVAITFAEPREHRMIRNIELLTRRKIEVGRLPTVLDVRAKQLEITRASVREALVTGDLDRYRVIVAALADEYDLMDIATAAMKLAHDATVGPMTDDDTTFDVVAPATPRSPRERGRTAGAPAAPRGAKAAGMARIYIGAGRKANMRPADLVGAIANEAGLDARQIGAIEINDRFSLVELPDELIDPVIAALRAATIKGKRQTVRRDLANRRVRA